MKSPIPMTVSNTLIQVLFIEQWKFIEITGRQTILTHGKEGDWDGATVEVSDILRDGDDYYLFYQACGQDKKMRIGVARSRHPMGLFEKCGNGPMLDVGPQGSWDQGHVINAAVRKEKKHAYSMWYSGCSENPLKWSVGYAQADKPTGPWTKYTTNPVLYNFGYLAGAIKGEYIYRLYGTFPILRPWAGPWLGRLRTVSSEQKYDPLSVAEANTPNGRFVKRPSWGLLSNPRPGNWDDGGVIDAQVSFQNGRHHLYYCASRRNSPDSVRIGYGSSGDGLRFGTFSGKPLVGENDPKETGIVSDVHALYDGPLIYLYYTFQPEPVDIFDGRTEAIGVQVLAAQHSFGFNIPILQRAALPAGGATLLNDCVAVNMAHASRIALTVEYHNGTSNTIPPLMRLRSSYDGLHFDTVDLRTIPIEMGSDRFVQKTIELMPKVQWIKAVIENPDHGQPLIELKVIASFAR
ncbi:MAG: hypothetical protein JXA82_00390 [Sedimentisphaerales bacterium]|nr:hypothetical protein [Sedimentisphaerales bacterium]